MGHSNSQFDAKIKLFANILSQYHKSQVYPRKCQMFSNNYFEQSPPWHFTLLKEDEEGEEEEEKAFYLAYRLAYSWRSI